MVLWLRDYSIKHDLSGSCSSSGPIASGTDLLHCVPVDFSLLVAQICYIAYQLISLVAQICYIAYTN